MSSKSYLLTGVTGGLGSKVLDDMLIRLHVPKSEITVTSRSEQNRERFEKQGLQFKILDYNKPETIRAALEDVENFFFVSSSEFRNDVRRVEHQNVVDAAKAAGVKKTWYVSLAFGGFEVNRKVSVQEVHNDTEEMLIKSGIDFVSLRAGVYTDAFPLFLNWYPTAEAIHLPKIEPPVSEGHLALTSRDELGEGMATLLVKGFEAFPTIEPKTDRKIVLLTASETVTFVDLADAINQTRGTQQKVDYLPPTEWVETAAKDDLGGKSKAWFETRLVWFQNMTKGAVSATDPALATLLGRKPVNGVEDVRNLLTENPDYSWHQNSTVGRR